jgi:hypothetical protein
MLDDHDHPGLVLDVHLTPTFRTNPQSHDRGVGSVPGLRPKHRWVEGSLGFQRCHQDPVAQGVLVEDADPAEHLLRRERRTVPGHHEAGQGGSADRQTGDPSDHGPHPSLLNRDSAAYPPNTSPRRTKIK